MALIKCAISALPYSKLCRLPYRIQHETISKGCWYILRRMHSMHRVMEKIVHGAGLPPTFWQAEKRALAAAGLHRNHSAPSSPGKNPSTNPGQRAGQLSGRAMPGIIEESLDGIVFAKVPGPWPAQKPTGLACMTSQ